MFNNRTMPPRLTLKPWRPSRHRTLRLKLNHLFPFFKMEDHVKHSPAPSSSSSASSSVKKTKKRRKGFRGLLLILRRPKWGSSKIDKVGELPEFSRLSERVYPSPVTPAYVMSMAKSMAKCAARGGGLEEADDDDDDVGDACKNFERCVVEMIVDGGRVEDLTDVEELLCCWQNLKCPVYVELVCRFYAEMCEDMFCANYKHE